MENHITASVELTKEEAKEELKGYGQPLPRGDRAIFLSSACSPLRRITKQGENYLMETIELRRKA